MTRLAAASPGSIAAAAACLRGGGLVAMPTETVYGLAADATSDAAVAAIYAAKERPAINPLIAHVLDLEAAREHAVFGPEAERLARAFWPGPLTLVLPIAATCRVSLLARAGLDTVAMRSPAHETARALIEAAGVPLAAPSANRSGRVSPTTAAHVVADLDGRVDWILDGGPCRYGLESTIVEIVAGAAPIAAPGRDRARSDRIRARYADRVRPPGRKRRRARPGSFTRTTRPAPIFASAPPTPMPARRRSISAACSRRARQARGSICRRGETLSRRRRICSPICGRSTPAARRGSRSRRSLLMGSGRRSMIGSGGRPRRGQAERPRRSELFSAFPAWSLCRQRVSWLDPCNVAAPHGVSGRARPIEGAMNSDFSWDEFRLVKSIADARSLVGAAERLGVNPSTVYRRLAAVEAAVGARLFDRSRAGYEPTAPGEDMIALAATMAELRS